MDNFHNFSLELFNHYWQITNQQKTQIQSENDYLEKYFEFHDNLLQYMEKNRKQTLKVKQL